jgi:hypothetical protein
MSMMPRNPPGGSLGIHRLLLPLCVMGALLGAGAFGDMLLTMGQLRTDVRETAAAFMERISHPPAPEPETRWWIMDADVRNVGMTGNLEGGGETR